jgi:hypothetical protein
MDTRTRIRLFAGSTLAVLAFVTGLGLNTDSGRHPASGPSTSVAANREAIGDDAGEAD